MDPLHLYLFDGYDVRSIGDATGKSDAEVRSDLRAGGVWVTNGKLYEKVGFALRESGYKSMAGLIESESLSREGKVRGVSELASLVGVERRCFSRIYNVFIKELKSRQESV